MEAETEKEMKELSPNATSHQHEEAWAKIHDLLAAGHWTRAREIFDQAVSADRDKIIEECAVLAECAEPNDGRDHSECPFCCTAKEVRALKNAAPQGPASAGNHAANVMGHTPAVAAPIAPSAIPSAEAYVLAIQQSVGSILSQYAANKILDRAKEIENGH